MKINKPRLTLNNEETERRQALIDAILIVEALRLEVTDYPFDEVLRHVVQNLEWRADNIYF